MDEVAGSTADSSHAKVFHQHDLAVSIAAGGRDYGSTQGFCTVVSAQTACEQTVSIGYLDDIVGGHSHGFHTADENFFPDFEVFFGIAHNNRLAGGSAGGVNAHDFIHRAGKQTKRIGVAQVFFNGKRQFRDVFQFLYIVGSEVSFFHSRTEEGNPFVSPEHGLLQAGQLKLSKFFHRKEIRSVDGIENNFVCHKNSKCGARRCALHTTFIIL